MSIYIQQEECIGCGACLSRCPFGALEMDENTAKMTAACTSCGACAETCPVGAIKKAAVEGHNLHIDSDDYRGVWVYIEQVNGKAKNVGYELVGQGRKLANELGEELSAVIIGLEVAGLATDAIAYGADKVYIVEGAEYKDYSTDAHTSAFADLISAYKPSVVLLGATEDGRDLAPRVACRVKTGLTADCTELSIDDKTKLVAWTRPAFGGNIMATILCPEFRPQMGTVRPKVFKQLTPDYSRRGEIIRVPGKVQESDIRTRIIDFIKVCNSVACNLEDADIIVAGGRGMGKPENFALLEELAAVLGGTVGSSRAAVDAGWQPAITQIGQTGKTVGPKVYFACGISGAIQHVAGMSSSDIIIAINKDQNAPIFKLADYGIVGDVIQVVPALIDEFKKVKSS